jgi:glycosyltransferase involved in cell wall biosynthesis
VPVRVIPTCAEVERFGDTAPGEGPRAVWCGSLGTVYRFDLAVRFAEALRTPFLVLTRQVEAARELLGGREADVREVAHSEIAGELRPGDVGLCFYADGGALGNLGRAPTRVAEYLAAGMAVAITPRIGDMDALVAGNGLGVRVEDESDAGLKAAAAAVLRLAADADLRARGQRLAAELFSVDDGADSYLDLYRELQSRSASSGAVAERREPAGAAARQPAMPHGRADGG